jgi:hypothetical protein
MSIIGDGKHDSGNELSLTEINGVRISTDRTQELSLDKVKVKLLVGTTRQGNKIVELIQSFERDDISEGCAEYNAALDALESLILAHASNNIDVTSEAYQNGVQTALDACANNL